MSVCVSTKIKVGRRTCLLVLRLKISSSFASFWLSHIILYCLSLRGSHQLEQSWSEQVYYYRRRFLRPVFSSRVVIPRTKLYHPISIHVDGVYEGPDQWGTGLEVVFMRAFHHSKLHGNDWWEKKAYRAFPRGSVYCVCVYVYNPKLLYFRGERKRICAWASKLFSFRSPGNAIDPRKKETQLCTSEQRGRITLYVSHIKIGLLGGKGQIMVVVVCWEKIIINGPSWNSSSTLVVQGCYFLWTTIIIIIFLCPDSHHRRDLELKEKREV